MKHITISMLAVSLFLFGCGDSGTQSDGATGRISIEALDAPPVLDYNIEKINLTVKTVTALNVESGNWDTLGTPNETIDFLELVNGTTASIADTSLPVGAYSQIRLILADTNEIVADGITYDLKVPSGTESGVKLHVNVEIVEDGLVELYVDFDASKSVTVTGGGPGNTIGASTKFILKPSFKAFLKSQSGSVSGTVQHGSGGDVAHTMIRAISEGDSSNTFTTGDGNYRLILPAGTYEISAHAKYGMQPDTTYTGVVVHNAINLTGYDFIIE